MAFDSLLGGGSGTNTLDPTTAGLLTNVLNGLGSVSSVIITPTQTSVSGVDSNGFATISLVGRSASTPLVFDSPTIDASNLGGIVVVAGPPISNPATQSNSVVDFIFKASATNDVANQAAKDIFLAAVTNAVNIVLPQASGAKLETVVLASNQAGAKSSEVIVAGNPGTEKNLLAVDVGGVAKGQTVALENIESAVIVGGGTVRISGTTSAIVSGDNADQTIIGGKGNDTLVGGGGKDTLNGGAGNDTYGLTGGTNSAVTIEGFESGKDKLAFKMQGVTDFNSLRNAVQKVEYINGNIVANFKDGSVVTLVGVTPDQLVESLFSYTI